MDTIVILLSILAAFFLSQNAWLKFKNKKLSQENQTNILKSKADRLVNRRIEIEKGLDNSSLDDLVNRKRD